MSHIFHPREQHYPTKSFEIEIKGRKFFINSHGGYRGQLDQVKHLMLENGIDPATALSMCFANWCSARPNLCEGKAVKAQTPESGVMRAMRSVANAVMSAVAPSAKRRTGRGCSSCGGGRTT
jgi:hypothetical protein